MIIHIAKTRAQVKSVALISIGPNVWMKTKKRWANEAPWGSSAILSWDNRFTVIASMNDSMYVSVDEGFLFSMRWSAHKILFSIGRTEDEPTIPPKRKLKNSHHKEIASEWYRTAKSSNNIRYGCQCSQKYPPLNLNKLYLQCPRREKWTRLSYKTGHAGKISKLWLGSTS